MTLSTVRIFASHRLLTIVLMFTLLSACEKEDPRFDGAKSIAAADIPQKARRNRVASAQEGEPHQLPHRHDDAPERQKRPSAPPREPSDSVENAPQRPTTTPPTAPAVEAPEGVALSLDAYGKVGPVRWTAPESWEALTPSSSFRMAEYRTPGNGGTTSGNLSIYHFPGGGGGIQANIDRWIAQFKGGSHPGSRRKTKVGSLDVWRVEAEGVYDPGVMAGGSGPREDYALLGAIVERPEGPFFFKLVGPKPTIDGNKKDFDAFVESFQPGTP